MPNSVPSVLRTIIAIVVPLVLLPVAAAENAHSVYLIGNSLTWDTVPTKLDGDVQWHVDCGKSLPFIYENPAKPCVASSTLWPQALKQKQYKMISLQPHYGSTVAEDVATIEKWLELQPSAIVIIHSGWAYAAAHNEEFEHSDFRGKMKHSQAYFRELTARLKKRHPQRTFRETRAFELLEKIDADIAADKAPFKNLSDLYRDKIHMTITAGRYLMHNAMRQALEQPISSRGFEKVQPNTREYLNSVLKSLD